jgi:hypothetical protein
MKIHEYNQMMSYLTRKPTPAASSEELGTQLELAAGGVVNRENFKYGASKAFKEFLEKQILKNKTTYNSLDELINKSNTDINQANAIKLLKNEYPDTFKIKVENEYFPIHENPKVTLKAIEGFEKLKKWEKNPTAENWFSVFRVTEPSGKIKQSKFAQGLRNYIQGKKGEGSAFNRYFDEIQLDENLYNKIKTYDKNLTNTLKAKKGSEVARKAIFEKSNQAINDINEQFKFDPNSSLEELTEALYGSQFKNADKKNKLILATQTSDDVLKYLKVLQGARPEQAKKIKLPDQETINDIVDNIAAGKKGGFRFQEGTLRQYKFDIRDTLLGLESGTSSQLRQKVIFGGKRVIDESVGLSATYERAPGYTEASQFLSPETNRIKGQVIDRPFKRALDKALDGDLSEVKEYNKIAKQFKKEYPDVDVPFIEIGKNPKDVVKYFNSFSKEAQKDILNIYNKSNISIRTNSKPLSVLVDEYQKAEKLEGKAKITALTALGLTSAGIANAEEVSNLTPMEASVLPSLSEVKNVIQENPITSGAAAVTSPLLTEKGRNIYKKVGTGALDFVSKAAIPLVVGLEGYRMGEDFKKGVPFSESLSGVMLMDEPIRKQKILNRMGDDARLLVKQTKGIMPEDGLDKLSMEEIDKFYTGLSLKPDLNLIQKYKDVSAAQEAERAVVAQQREAQFQKIRENFPEQKEIPDVYAKGGMVESKDDLYIPPLFKKDPSIREGVLNLAFGGRVNFAGGGIKLARLISDVLLDLKNSISIVGNTARFEGIQKAKLEALTPYKNVPNQSKHTTILESIDKARQNLPKEYHSILDDIKKDVDNFDYATADNRIMALDKTVAPELKFESLSKDLFPMEDPLNKSFIIMDPNRDYMTSRYIHRIGMDPETGRGIRQTFDTFDSESRKFLDEKDWKLIGVESLEKGKEGLN